MLVVKPAPTKGWI